MRERDLVTASGTVGMVGGALYPVLFGAWAMYWTGAWTQAARFTANYLEVLSALFWLVGIAGVLVYHRGTFGVLGYAGGATMAVGLLATALDPVTALATGEHLFTGGLARLSELAVLVGSLGLGAAVALAERLPHARIGGTLLAVGWPTTNAVVLAGGRLGSVEEVAVALAAGLPYGAAWIVVGYGLITVTDPSRRTAETESGS